MTEKVAAAPAAPAGVWLKIKPEYFLYLLVFLIPFQQRLYKFLRPFSLSLIDQRWNVPEYFEVHLDAFISDFVLLGLVFWCLKKALYTNNLKNREFDKKGPQNFCSERATIAERQGASENKNSEAAESKKRSEGPFSRGAGERSELARRDPTQSKTDSSSCLCIVQWKSFWDGESKYLSLFLFFALASIVNSDFASYPIPYWRWLHLALPAFLFFFLSRSRLEEGIFKKIAKITLVVALIESAIAILQYFVQHSLGLKGLGEPTLIATNYLAANFPMADGSIWLLDKFFHGIRQHTFVLRASGTLTHPNILGGFMVFSLLMTYHIYGVGKKRGWLCFAILLQTFCLFITYSRSAIFTAAFTTVVWIGLTWWGEKKLSSLIWVSAGSALLSLGLLYPQIFHRGGIVSYNVVSQSSDALRMTVADVGFAMFKAHPFLGVGFNNYMLAFPHFAKEIPATYIHNVYLHLGVEVGLFGALTFLTFCFFVLIRGWKSRHKPEVLTGLCIFMGLLVIGLADFYPLCQQEIRLVFFLAAGFLVSGGAAKIPVHL